MFKKLSVMAAVALAAVGVWVWLRSDTADVPDRAGNRIEKTEKAARIPAAPASSAKRIPGQAPVGEAAEPAEPAEEPKTEEEKREAEEERLVDAFDALTDRWQEPSKKSVSMADVEAFSAQFRKVPDERKEECLQRALNLVPDENVMLLVGILMDKSIDKELVELVYNDVLNRDEDVKKPILNEIFKDKSHPCWTDTAWILDVTGELPDKKAE